jgi:myosin heavy subunit
MSRPTSAGSDKSTGSAGSKESADSYTSTLSTDSYVTTLKPKLDEEFKQMLNEIRLADTNRTIAKERKIQSHEVKKRDPTDTERRTDWTPEMEAEHAQYKLTVKALERAKKVQDESEKLAKASKTADPATQERVRMQALRDDEAWLDAAIA